MACPAVRPHFFGACPKKRCRAAKEKRFFTPAAPPFAERSCLGGRDSSSPDLGRGWCLSVGLYVCADFLVRSRRPLLPIPPHFFALAQRNGVEPQRNALLGAATVAVGSRPPLPRTRSPNIPADCVKLTLPGQLTNRPQINLTHQFVPLGLRAEWERRAGPPSSCGGFKSAFLWRLDTVSLGKHQRNGVEWQDRATKTTQRNGAHVQTQRKKGGTPGEGSPLDSAAFEKAGETFKRAARSGQAVR